ncbi:MAG: RagB/SusD family nutrient uptake outer membrane protein [Prevotella sp.]|nr:RagB/SusD family nutrient uptake outer membrane protein [Prevotella sp.]
MICNMKKIFGLSIIALFMGLGLVSCDDWLDKLPDNRMELRTASDIKDLLVSAYAQNHPVYILEMSSDNADECVNTGWTEYDRLQRQAFNWDDITEIGQNDSPQSVWDAHYSAVAAANACIEHVDALPEEEKEAYAAQLGEALICRAYAMFTLSTVFCEAYDPTTANQHLGLPYPTATETVVGQAYERGTLADLYKMIDADIQRGLPLVKNVYDKPKFHFTPDAANAFAARFYLNYCDYNKVIEYASKVLGSNPYQVLRDWESWAGLTLNQQVAPEAYMQTSNRANLFEQVIYSSWGVVHGNYSSGCKYAHGNTISTYETLESVGPWGESYHGQSTTYGLKYGIFINNSLSKRIMRKIPYEFEYTDLQARIGYAHSELVPFTTDILLLERAEAYALAGNLQAAVDDVNTELKAFAYAPFELTVDSITKFYNKINYYVPYKTREEMALPNGRELDYADYYTPKKHLSPKFISLTEGSQQESVLQCILHLRRILTIHEGMRFQDIKRYGITIYRRTMDDQYYITGINDTMDANDPRHALQLPQDVITAGLEANPRNK